MRNLKRVLSTALAIAMMMSLVVFSTSAAFNDQDKIVNTDAVNMNVALNIINGLPDGSFNPEGNVTRAEMAKMICIVLNGGTEPAVSAKSGAATFTDIRGHWAEGYIEYCVVSGVVAGMGDGTFQPNGSVTATQAAKMLLVALGYDAVFEGFNGANWNVKINVAASQKNLYEDVVMVSVNNPLSRDNAAQMVWNALNAKEVKYTYSLTTVNGALQNVQVREDKDDTLLEDKYNTAADYEAVMIGYKLDTKTKEYTYTMLENYAAAIADPDVAVTSTFKSKTDFTGLYGLNVSVVYKDTTAKTVYGMYAEDSVVLATGVAGKLDTSTGTEIKFDGTKYEFDYTVTPAGGSATATEALEQLPAYAVNVWTVSDYDSELDANPAFEVRLIDVDDNGDVDYVVYAPFTVEKVTYLGSKSLTLDGITGNKNLADINYFTGIAKDDYAKVTAAVNTADKTITLEKVDAMVDGKVTRVSSNTYYIDGTAYKLTGSAAMLLGDKVADAPVVNGYIFAADTSGTTSVEDYAVVIGADLGAYATTAKLLFADGTKKVVDTDTYYDTLIDDLVTFTINSDDEYELELATFPADGDGTGFDAAIDETGLLDPNTGKLKYINDWNIADDAVIFVATVTLDEDDPDVILSTSYKTITGTQLKNTKADDLSLVGAFAVDTSSTGYSTVKLAYITSTTTLTTADYLYGYAVADYADVKNSKNENVFEYTLWNGSEDITILSTKAVATDSANEAYEGDVVRYTVNNDGEVEDIDVLTASSDGVAIVAYDGKYIQTTDNSTTSDRLEIDSADTVVLYIDSDELAGVEGGSVALATKDSDNDYYFNAFVIAEDGETIDLLVFDVTNNLLD